MRTSIRISIVAAALVGGLLAISCAEREKQAERRDPRERLRPTDPETAAGARRHGEQGERLRDLMRDLDQQTAYAPTNDLPADPESSKVAEPRGFDEVLTLSSALADAAARIPAAADDVKMFKDERVAFDAEAANLRRNALDLGAAAKAHNVARMQRTFDRINASCVECHRRFGDFAGPLEAPDDGHDGPAPEAGPR